MVSMNETSEGKEYLLTLIREHMLGELPVNKLLGIEADSIKEGYVEVRVPFKNEFVGDFRRGLWHGGILASIADTAGRLAGATTLTNEKDKINTIDMRIDYLNPAIKKPIYVVVKLIKIGKRIIKDVKTITKSIQT